MLQMQPYELTVTVRVKRVSRALLMTLAAALIGSVAGSVILASAAVAQGFIVQGGDDAVVPTAAANVMKPTTSEGAPAAEPAPTAAAAPAPAAAAKSAAAAAAKTEATKKPVAAKKPAPTTTAAKTDTAKTTTGAIPAKAKGDGSMPSEQSIVALVNDEPITGYEVRQRAQMMSGGDIAAKAQANFKALIQNPNVNEKLKAILQETIKANPGKSKEQILAAFEVRKKDFAMNLQKQAVESARSSALPAVKKAALDELIDEKLKMQEAKRVGAVAGDDEIDKIVEGIAQRNKMSKDQLAKQFGGTLEPMRVRVRSTLAWQEVIRRKFGRDISIATRDVDKYVASAQAGGDDGVELQIQRIRLAIPAKLDAQGVAQRVSEAEAIRAKFQGCKSTKQLTAGVKGAQFEELGKRPAAAIPEPTRSLLLNAKDDEMLPPSVEADGVSLFAVCGRTVIKAEEQKRVAAEGELKQKELELLAKRLLKDLRQDAHIEYR